MKQTRIRRQPLAICLALSALAHAALIELPGPPMDGTGAVPIVVTLRPASIPPAAEQSAEQPPAQAAPVVPPPHLPPKREPIPQPLPESKPKRQRLPEPHQERQAKLVVVSPPASAPASVREPAAAAAATEPIVPLPERPEPPSAPAQSADADASAVPVEAAFGASNGPRVLEIPTPDYPLRARRLRREGRVLVRLTLDRSGSLQGVSIEKAAGHGFDAAALAAVRRARFAPARRNGRAVACVALLPIYFNLQP